MAKNQTYDNTIDLVDLKSANKKRARQSVITQTWAMLSSMRYDEYDYDAWLMDFDIEAMELEKEIIAMAVDNVLAVQKQFDEYSRKRRRLRRVK